MRLATFNVQHGRGADGVADPRRLARAVAALDADVVALQEVDRAQSRSGWADLAFLAAEAADATDHRFVPAVAGPVAVWGARRRARGDEPSRVPGYGIALLTRHPVRAWHRLRLPLAVPWLLGRGQVARDEPRAALAAELDTPEGPLTVVCTHLSSGRTGHNVVQLRYLQDALRVAPRPLVLLGDLNLRGRIPQQVTGWRPLATAATYPNARPRFQIDHVLADGPVVAAGEARSVDTGVSDHRALVVDVRLGAPQEG
nr:endonuclease/exonuclease/phosphatase family protein [Antribacter gilvus]